MNDIGWYKAPYWANYVAMDDNGNWYWHAERPVPRSDVCCWVSSGRMAILSSPESYYSSVDCALWKSTLQERPKKTDKSYDMLVSEYGIFMSGITRSLRGEVSLEFDMPDEYCWNDDESILSDIYDILGKHLGKDKDETQDAFDEEKCVTRKEVKEIVKDSIARYHDSFGGKKENHA